MSGSTLETFEMVAGGVTTPAGFRAAGVSAGIKAKGLDLALLVSDREATAAAVFTTNRAQAAPILVSHDHLTASGGVVRAVIVNSGCANACTGDAGLLVARGMAAETARLVGCPAAQVLVASTGVIGVSLDLDKIGRALPAAMHALAADQGALAARAIMTTDPFPKEAAARLSIGGKDVAIGGMAKGSGMIEPMMATMLGFVTTDAAVPKGLLDRALREVVNDTFNAITVDGECSTNDCVMLLANGASGAVVDDVELRGVRLRAADRLPGARARHRARRRRGDQARHRQRHRRGNRRGRASRREGDRELAAREDRSPWRRSELGPAHRRGRAGQRRVRAVARRGDDRIDRPVQGRRTARRGGARTRRAT